MFGNLKEFISVVHDGLSTNNNLRQTLQEVQKVRNIFKDKQKSTVESKVNYAVGGQLLDKYQENWEEMHKNADMNAKAAEEVDKVILELHHTASKRLISANNLVQSLSYLPALTASVAQCIDSMKHIESMLKDVEENLIELEDVVEQKKMEKSKLDHHYHLSLYKEKKLASLEEIRSKLSKENSDMSMQRERQQLAELQRRSESSAAAFQSDISTYLSTGSVRAAPAPKSQLSLEQIQLDDNADDLEKFLDS